MSGDLMDVLMYMFERCIDDDAASDADRDGIGEALVSAGFQREEVERAFDWLDGLIDESGDDVVPASPLGSQPSIRMYGRDEQARLDVDCRGFLQFLEQSDILDVAARERVIERVMALDTDEVDLERLKWVVLMVLFNRADQASLFPWVEEVVLDCASGGAVH